MYLLLVVILLVPCLHLHMAILHLYLMYQASSPLKVNTKHQSMSLPCHHPVNLIPQPSQVVWFPPYPHPQAVILPWSLHMKMGMRNHLSQLWGHHRLATTKLLVATWKALASHLVSNTNLHLTCLPWLLQPMGMIITCMKWNLPQSLMRLVWNITWGSLILRRRPKMANTTPLLMLVV